MMMMLMPLLLLILLILLGYATQTGAFGRGVEFLFAADFSKLSAEAVLVAMGHSFFTLSLGMGAIMAYGAYLPKQVSIPRTALVISVMDTLVALVAGLVIFSIVFAFDLAPDQGISLIFKTLPLAFAQMPYGEWVGCLFFLLLAFAALTSAISLLEPAVAWLVDGCGWDRHRAAIFTSGLAWLLGIGSVLSLNLWSDLGWFGGWTLLDGLDFLTSSLMLPIGGAVIAVFVGWKMQRQFVLAEMGQLPAWLYPCWIWALRVVAPSAVLMVLATKVWEKLGG